MKINETNQNFVISCKSDGETAHLMTFVWCKYIINQKLPFKGADGFAEC